MANSCSNTLKIDKLPKIIKKVEYFLFQAMKQNNINYFQVANNPTAHIGDLMFTAKKLIEKQIGEYTAQAVLYKDEGNLEIFEYYETFVKNLQNIVSNWPIITYNTLVYSKIFGIKTKFKLDDTGMVNLEDVLKKSNPEKYKELLDEFLKTKEQSKNPSSIKFKLDNEGLTDLSELSDDDDVIYKKFIVDQSANEVDPFDAIDKAIEIFIHSIPKEGVVDTEYGFNVNIDYPSFVRNLMADLENAITIDEMVNKLRSKLDKTPEYRHVIDMLEFKESDNSITLQLKINFRNSFAKALIPIYITSIENETIKVFEATTAKRSKYEQDVRSNFSLKGMPVMLNNREINLAHDDDGMWVLDETDLKKILTYLNAEYRMFGEKEKVIDGKNYFYAIVNSENIQNGIQLFVKEKSKLVRVNQGEELRLTEILSGTETIESLLSTVKSTDIIFKSQPDIYSRKTPFLKSLGFEFSEITEEKLKTEFKQKKFEYLLLHLLNRISLLSEKDKARSVINNPIDALKTDYRTISKFNSAGQNNSINGLIELEIQFNPEYNVERSIINPSGDRVHSTQLHNNFTIINKYLSDNEAFPNDVNNPPLQKIIETEPSLSWLDARTNPGVRNSLYLNSLFFLDPSSADYGMRRRIKNENGKLTYSTTEGEYVILKIVNTGYLQTKDENFYKTDGAASTNLNEADKLLQDLSLFMSAGFSSILRLGDKSTDLGIFANYYMDAETGNPYKKPLGVLQKQDDYRDVFATSAFAEAMLNGLKDFVGVKYLGHKGFYEDFELASENIIKTFGEFDKILSDETKTIIQDAITSDKIENVEQAVEVLNDPTLVPKIKDDIKTYFNDYADEYLKKLEPVRKLVKDTYLINGNFESTVKYFLANAFLMDLETLKLFFGNAIHFKEFTKRASANSATGIFTFLEPELIDKFNDKENQQGIGVNTNLASKLLIERLFIQNKITLEKRNQLLLNQNISKEFKSGLIEEVEFISKEAGNIIKNIDGLYKDDLISQKSYDLFNNNIKEVIQKKYKGDEADGQGKCTFDFYRIMSILTNNWDYETQEPVYKKIIEYSHYDELAEGEEDETKRAEYIAKRDAVGYDPTEQVYFPPKKFQYSGPLKHEKLIDNVMYNALIPEFDKFSLQPLIPTIIKNTEDEELAKRMDYEGVGYVKLRSASKVEKVKNLDSLYEGYDKENPEVRFIKTFDQRLNDNTTAFKSEHTLFMTHLKEQVRIDAEVHDDVIFGSQPRKLLLMNLLALDTEHNKEEFKRLYNAYTGLIDNLVTIEKSTIYNKLGITEKNGKLELTDFKKLAEYFRDEISKKNQDSNVRKALELDSTGKFKTPLDAAVQAQVIEGILISSINNNIVRYKTSGSMLTQVSITGSGKKFSKTLSEEALQTYGNIELKYYDIVIDKNGKKVTSAMQVKVGFTKQWVPLLNLNHYDNNKIDSLQRLNECLKNLDWVENNRDSIRMIGYRIPTQGRNFIDVMEVAEFLPAQFGDAIIMPSEMVIKNGGDFDIDKLFVFYPNLLEDGSYENLNYTNSFLKNSDASKYKNTVQNKLYKVMSEIILHPNNYMELVTPSENFHILPIIDKLYDKLGLKKVGQDRPKTDYKNTDILNRNRNIEKFLSLLNGKSDLGIAALANTFNVLYQLSGAEANPEFLENISTFFKKRDKSLLEDLVFGEMYDEDGVLKSEFFSEFINAFVDVARDDYVFGVNVVTEFSPMLFYMKFAGLSSKKILAFINQPILRTYISNLAKYENMFVKNYIDSISKEDLQSLNSYTEEDKDTDDYKTQEKRINNIIANSRRKAQSETLKEFGFINIEAADSIKDEIEKLLGKADYSEFFTAQNLYNNIQNIKTFNPTELNEKQKNVQLAVFYEMLNLKIQSDSMSYAQKFLNFDTKPYVSTFDVYARDVNYASAIRKKDNILSPDTLKSIREKSVISPLNVSNEIKLLLETLLPIRNNNVFNNSILERVIKLKSNFQNKNIISDDDMLKYARTAKNDFMNYILQNFFDKSKNNGHIFKRLFETDKPLNEYLKELIETDKLRKNLLKIKNLEFYNDLVKEFPIIKTLAIEQSNNTKNLITYKFIQSSSNNVEKQSLISQFDDLVNLSDNEDNKLPRTFMKDLALYSIFQSGFNTSDISYTGITPIELINTLYALAQAEFERLSTEEKQEEYKNFFKLFSLNNPGFYAGRNSKDTITGEVSKKGKWYSNETKLDKLKKKEKAEKKSTQINLTIKEIKVSSSDVNKIKNLEKTLSSITTKIPNGVYKLVNEEGNIISVQLDFYKTISLLNLDTDAKKEAYAKGEGFKSWYDLEYNVSNNRKKVLKEAFLEGNQIVFVYKIKNLSDQQNPSVVPTPVIQPTSNIFEPKGEKVKDGIYINQGVLTKEEQLELFNYLKPFLEQQAAKTLKSDDASKMIGLGLRWDYKNNNSGRQAVNIPDLINEGNRDKYGYYNTSINGQALGQIIPRFRELMQKATGVDMTNYDGAIINLYDNETFISSHNDVDESKSAIKYPVIGINLGGTGNFSIESRDGSPKQLNLKPGTGYIFGVDGKNRQVYHRTFPGKQDSFLPALTTILDKKTYEPGSYRVTITMRRVMPLEPGMPTSPKMLTTQPSSVKENVDVYQGYTTLENREFNYYTLNEEEAKNYGKNVRKVDLNTKDFLKYTDPAYNTLINEFSKAGKTFDILDNSKEGLSVQESFFRFLKSKGYKGLSLLGRTDNNYVITFSEPSVNEFDLADKLTPIEQNFTDGQGGRQMQDKFKGKSTMDLIISGDRTRTTRAKTDIQRMAKDYSLSKISDLTGKVIRMTDKTGRQVYTRITKVAKFTQEYQDDTWQKEGWIKSVTDKHVDDYPYAIEFEVINKPTQPSTNVEGTLSIQDVLKEFTLEELKQGVNLKSLQDKVLKGDEETIKTAYNYLKAFEKVELLKKDYDDTVKRNKEITKKINSLTQKINGAIPTKVGDILNINNDENGSDYKVKVLEITKNKDYAILKVITAKKKEYTIRAESDGSTKNGDIDNFVFESNNEDVKTLRTEKENLKSQLISVEDSFNYDNVFSKVWKDYFISTQQPTSVNPLVAAEYTNHSGGAEGSDTQWDKIGKEFGMVNNKHYYTGEKGPKNAPLGNVDISNQPIAIEGATKVAEAAKEMWGYKYNTMKDPKLIRNWAQVYNSDAVFAIGTLGKIGDVWKHDEKAKEPRRLLKYAVQGGTGYAVEMAIQSGKPVYLFDQVRNQWYKNINNTWSKSEIPVLTKNFAGVGTREINEMGIKAIRDVYKNTFKNATSKPIINNENITDLSKEVINKFRNSVTWNYISTDEELLDMYDKQKLSGQTLEEFLQAMSCLGKIK